LEEPVLSVRDLNIVYEVGEGVHAVKDASFTLRRGEILGLAGESGCGKTTLAYGLNQLHRPPARITSGAVTFHDRTDGSEVDVLALEGAALRTFRWSKVAMVFQGDRKSTRLNSSHVSISYAVFCLKKNTSSSCAWLCLGNRHSTGTE